MNVLLVDDHPEVRLSLGEFLEQLGHRVSHAGSGREALRAIAESRPQLVLTDLRMPGMSGLELLQALERFDEPPPLAVMTAFGDADTAVEALRLGAVDYLRKPIDVRELHRLVDRIGAAEVTAAIGGPPREEADGLVVMGEAMERLVALADRLHLAPDLPCLIEGETGVGKDLFARRIHHGGTRGVGPFVAVNCAAIAPGLFEAELFGYAPGAFTGAAPGGAEGKLAHAAGGTIFLDELGDLPLDQQAKLLRLIEERAWYPVGSNQLRKLSARVVGATNVGLIDRVRTKAFREDLYYRLKVGHLHIPALRERRDTIVPLARILLARAARRRARGEKRLASDAEAYLREQPWPGNVRQLQHVLEQACLLEDGAVLSVKRLASCVAEMSPVATSAPFAPDPRPVGTGSPLGLLALSRIPPQDLTLSADGCDLDAWTRGLVVAALARHEGSPVRTATFLGISRKVLYTLRKRYGLLPTEEGEGE